MQFTSRLHVYLQNMALGYLVVSCSKFIEIGTPRGPTTTLFTVHRMQYLYCVITLWIKRD